MDADGWRRRGRHFGEEVPSELPVGLMPAATQLLICVHLRPSAVNLLCGSTVPPRLSPSVSPCLSQRLLPFAASRRMLSCALPPCSGRMTKLFHLAARAPSG